MLIAVADGVSTPIVIDVIEADLSELSDESPSDVNPAGWSVMGDLVPARLTPRVSSAAVALELACTTRQHAAAWWQLALNKHNRVACAAMVELVHRNVEPWRSLAPTTFFHAIASAISTTSQLLMHARTAASSNRYIHAIETAGRAGMHLARDVDVDALHEAPFMGMRLSTAKLMAAHPTTMEIVIAWRRMSTWARRRHAIACYYGGWGAGASTEGDADHSGGGAGAAAGAASAGATPTGSGMASEAATSSVGT